MIKGVSQLTRNPPHRQFLFNNKERGKDETNSSLSPLLPLWVKGQLGDFNRKTNVNFKKID